MTDLGVALGLVLVIEGLLWAAMPRLGVRLLETAKSASENELRAAGAVAVAVGVLIVWSIRG